ncbi:HNH endonuclease [Cutibacterium avidum]|uniref:HNH endonuclease n=1 Tax=Cutibacterium avidum TaxID=33010 RepID=UPI003AF7040C
MALKLLSDDKVAQLVSRRISAIRNRRRRSRRLDWHNSWLWAFLDACVASPRSGCSVDDWDVSRSDSVVLAHQRNSQSDFRRRLLESGPVECAICGLDLPELLEAAHLVPHARGGAGQVGRTVDSCVQTTIGPTTQGSTDGQGKSSSGPARAKSQISADPDPHVTDDVNRLRNMVEFRFNV